MEKRMARFIQGDRPEAGPELAMTGWKLARLFLGVALIRARRSPFFQGNDRVGPEVIARRFDESRHVRRPDPSRRIDRADGRRRRCKRSEDRNQATGEHRGFHLVGERARYPDPRFDRRDGGVGAVYR